MLATLWMQSAAEYRALAWQAFHLARLQLERQLAEPREEDLPPAVIVDVDETVLDNTPYQAWLVGRDEGYSSESWGAWVAQASAVAVPGAQAFLDYARRHDVAVFYVTNSRESGRAATLRNLQAVGFPDADDAHLLMRTDSSDKSARRERIERSYRVAVMIGDNLGDFSARYDVDDVATRNRRAAEDRAHFGERWIVLPNPTYGGWESALYDGEHGLTAAQKASARQAALEKWSGPEAAQASLR